MPPSHDQGRRAGATAGGGEAGPVAWLARRAPAAAPAPGRCLGAGRRPPSCPCLRRATAQRPPPAGGSAIEVLTKPRIATRVRTVNSRRTSEIGDNRSKDRRRERRRAASGRGVCNSGPSPAYLVSTHPYVPPGEKTMFESLKKTPRFGVQSPFLQQVRGRFGKLFLRLLLVLVPLVLLRSCVITYVAPGEIGVRQIAYGPSKGLQKEPVKSGYRREIASYEAVHTFPRDIQAVDFTNHPSERGASHLQRPAIKIPTVDGYPVDV